MFLFRRKKNNAEQSAESKDSKTAVKPEKKEKPGKEGATAVLDNKSGAEKPRVVKVTGKEKPGKKDDGVKVISASELEEDDQEVAAPVAVSGPAKPAVPEEVVDSLLVPVKREPVEETEVPSLAGTVLPKSEKTESPAGKVEKPVEQATPVAPSPVPVPEVKAEAPAEKPKEEKAPEPPKPEAKKAAEGEDKGNLFSSLFGKSDVVEETPLDRLIKSLPDITIEEVMNEAEEVKGLMNEWFQNQNR